MEVWVAFAALIVTIFVVSGGGLAALFSKMETNKTSLETTIDEHKKNIDAEIEAIRLAAYTEYKDLRREMNDGWGKAYLEFGEGPKAVREKLTQVELFMRDTYLPIPRFEREQDQILKLLQNIEKKLDRYLQPKVLRDE